MFQEFDDFCARIRSENLDLVIQNEKTAVQEWQEIDKVNITGSKEITAFLAFYSLQTKKMADSLTCNDNIAGNGRACV